MTAQEIPPEKWEAAGAYTLLMAEVKVRHRCVITLLEEQTGLHRPFVREFALLQIRMITESIALGCLVAHGDIEATQTKQFRKLWRAGDIIDQLEALHCDFFPVPIAGAEAGPDGAHFGAGPQGALTKADLLSLYGKCGSVLHRGTRDSLWPKAILEGTDFPDIVRWANALHDLLHNHYVLMLGGKTVFICEMGAGPEGTPKTSIGVAPTPSRRVP